MNRIIFQALMYVRNTNGGATEAHFLDDHDPIGSQLWRDLTSAGFATTDQNGKIILTTAGQEAVEAGGRV